MAHKVLWARTLAMPISLTSYQTCLLTHKLLVSSSNIGSSSHSGTFQHLFSLPETLSPDLHMTHFLTSFRSLLICLLICLLRETFLDDLFRVYLITLPEITTSPSFSISLPYFVSSIAFIKKWYCIFICLSAASIRMPIPEGRNFAMLPLYPQA